MTTAARRSIPSLRYTTSDASIDEAQCAQEPIHIPGSIQSHGALVILAKSDLSVTQVSANIGDFCAVSAPGARGAPIATIVGDANAVRIESAIGHGDLIGFNPMRMGLEIGGATREFECVMHRAPGSFIVEFAPYVAPPDGFELDLARMRKPLARLGAASDITQLLRDAASLVQHLTGFDRTMVYRFHEDWHGEVVAESTSGNALEGTFLGLHFPAGDIPEQARRLYAANPVRIIADVYYTPVPLVPQLDAAGDPVDLSGAILRSVSPIHLEYLHNMGVRAAMSISIVIAGRLWGLIACHHRDARFVNYYTRDACVLVADTLARQLQLRLEAATGRAKLHANIELEALSAQLFSSDDLRAGLNRAGQSLLALFEAHGLVLKTGDAFAPVGSVPSDDEIARIVRALKAKLNRGVGAHHALGALMPEAPDDASGALLIALNGGAEDYLLFLRREVVHSVHWGSDTQTRLGESDGRLHPRRSFAVWKETVRGQSRPWSADDIANAQLIRQRVREHQFEAQQRRDAEAVRQSAAALQQSLRTLQQSNAALREKHDALQLTERALRKSESFLDRTGWVAGVGGWEVDLITGDVLWSDQTCRIIGVVPGYRPTLDEAIARYTPEAQPIIRNAIARSVTNGEAFDIEVPMFRVDGRRIWVRAVGTPECVDGKAVRLSGALQDVTERVTARVALEAANERVLLATQSGGIGIYEWDLTTGQLTWDTMMRQRYGLDPSEPAPSFEQWRLLVHPDDLAEVEATLRKAVESAAAWEIEFRIVWRDGSVHHVRSAGHATIDADGRPIRFVGVNWDVTEARRLADAVARQNQLLRVTMQSIGDGVITTDADANVTWLNPVAEYMTGWSAQDALEQPLTTVLNIINEQTRESVESPVTACLKHGTLVGLANQTVLVSRTGGEAAIEDSAAPIRNERGEILGAVLVFHDVTEQRRLSGEASHRAAHDALTGLPNRATFNERLDRSIAEAHRNATLVALLFIDLNKFKEINDTFGHAAGDRVLKITADRIKACVRFDGFVARLGGDEFVIVSPKLFDERDADVIAENVIAAVTAPTDVADLPDLTLGVSIGISLYPTDSTDSETMLAHADLAMYRSKKLRRSGFTRFGVSDSDACEVAPALQRRIVRGLERQEFMPYYQPIVDVDSRLLAGVEALARWTHPRLGLLAPEQFLAVAEDSGSIFRLGEVMLRTAILHTARWRATSRPDLRVSVNVSPRQFSDDRFVHAVYDIFSDTGASPDLLTIELTEAALFENNERATRTLRELADLGVWVAIDDFGVGYSSLSRLQHLPVHILKIDKSFIQDIAQPGNGRAIVQAIIAMGHSLGIRVVAEGVETATQCQILRDDGCDAIQGYLISEPLSHLDATTYIRRADPRSTARNGSAT